jgi:hypothetical protein
MAQGDEGSVTDAVEDAGLNDGHSLFGCGRMGTGRRIARNFSGVA